MNNDEFQAMCIRTVDRINQGAELYRRVRENPELDQEWNEQIQTQWAIAAHDLEPEDIVKLKKLMTPEWENVISTLISGSARFGAYLAMRVLEDQQQPVAEAEQPSDFPQTQG